MKNESKGVAHACKALLISLDGLATCFRREQAFRQECILGMLNLVAAVLVPDTWTETLVLVAVYLILPIVELLNSSIEEVVDMVSPKRDERAKRAKDYASAAVFLSVALVCLAWGCVLGRRFL